MLEKIECAPYSAVFSAEYCAKSHEKANTPEAIKTMWRQKCRRCPAGAANLGTDQYIERSVLFGSKTCARCVRQSNRLVRGVVCVSCYNRELENATGLNKRGNPLQLVRHYRRASVTLETRSGETKERELKMVLSEDEAVRSIQLTEKDLLRITCVVLQ